MQNIKKMAWLVPLLLSLAQPTWAADDLVSSQLSDQARTWQQKDRDDLAAELWRKVLRADPKHPEALVSLAGIELRAGNGSQAEALHARARRLVRPPAGLTRLSSALQAAKDAAAPAVPKVNPAPAPVPALVATASLLDKPANSRSEKTTEKSIDRTAEKLVEKPVEKPVAKLAEKPVAKPVEKIVEKPVPVQAAKATDRQIEKPPAQPIGKPAPKLEESPPQPASSLAEFETARATNEDWAQTRQAIEDLARKNPGNTLYLFALARHLTYRDATRREAIRMLAGLPPRVAGQRDTRKTWRQALVALEARSEDAPLYAAYLAQNPDDAAIRDQLRALAPKETPRDGVGMAPRSSVPPASGNVQGNQAKAAALMKQALADEQNAAHGAAAAKLESAMLLDPGNTSVRLALARQYQNLGMIGSAESLLDDLLAASPAMAEALHARAVLYGAQQKWLDGIKLMERIPASRRTAAVALDQRRMWLNVQVQRARQLYTRGDAKKANALMEMVQSTARADDRMMPTVASGWSEVGQSAKGLRLMRQFVSSSPPQDITTRIRYAEILLANYQDAELSAVLRDLATPGRLDTVQQTEVNAIILGYTLRLAEALRESGRVAEAAELMGPVMQRADDTRALLTMARIHRAASDPLQALALVEKAIVLEPDELGHRLLASEMALAIKAIDKADGQAKAALALAPDHPRALAAAGRVEKYRGNLPKALAYFQRAQSQEGDPQAFAGVAGNLALRLVDGEPAAATTPSTGKAPGDERSGLLPIPGPAPKNERRPDSESGYDTQRPGMKGDLPSMRIDQPGRLSQISMGSHSPASGVASAGRQSVLYQMPQMLPLTNSDYRDMAALNAAQQGATAATGIKLKLTTTLANPILTRSPGKLL